MDRLGGAIAVLGVSLVSTVLGLWARKRSAKIRHDANPKTLDASDSNLDQFGLSGAVVQFSTEFCSPYPNVKRELTAITRRHESLQLAHLDVTDRAGSRQEVPAATDPTVLIINAEGP